MAAHPTDCNCLQGIHRPGCAGNSLAARLASADARLNEMMAYEAFHIGLMDQHVLQAGASDKHEFLAVRRQRNRAQPPIMKRFNYVTIGHSPTSIAARHAL